jgi:hypothetical protein
MVKAIVEIDEYANRVLNIVKAKYGLRDKSEAINAIVEEYAEDLLEPELRPDYIKEAKRIQKQKAIPIGTAKALRKRYEG